MKKTMIDITVNALLGQATGDALGVPVEFMSREEVRKLNIQDLEGCDTARGKFGRWSKMIPAGAWSDDTSMTVAAMASITKKQGKIDYDHIMWNFLDWWELGRYCPVKHPFGLGATCSAALYNYLMGATALEAGPTGFDANGNGSLMRILPFSLYCIFKKLNLKQTVEIINNGSALTHGHEISKMGCMIFTVLLRELIYSHGGIDNAWEKTRMLDYSMLYGAEANAEYEFLLSDDFLYAQDNCINESGYVVDTLMAAVYSLLRGTDYESTLLTAVNLGGDTDTYGAVTGALAGVYYGASNIPTRWRERLLEAEALCKMASMFAKAVARK